MLALNWFGRQAWIREEKREKRKERREARHERMLQVFHETGAGRLEACLVNRGRALRLFLKNARAGNATMYIDGEPVCREGAIDLASSPQFLYPLPETGATPGEHLAELIVWDQSGCHAELYKSLLLHF